MFEQDRVIRTEAGVLETPVGDSTSKSYTARRAQILFDLDSRARAQAEAAELERQNRPWRRLMRWRGRRR
jgi:hypothetical protein